MSLISFSGLASGIDSQSLIKSIIDAQRRSSVDPIKRHIQTLTDTNDSLSTFKDLLNKFKDAASVFRDINGGGVEKVGSSSNEQVVSASVSRSATVGTNQVTVSQVARGGTSSFSDRFSSGTQAINSAIDDNASVSDRTVNVQVGTGTSAETVSIAVDSTTTADSFVQQFNSQSKDAQASLVNTGSQDSPSYALVISSKNTGTEQGTLAITTGTAITSAGSGALNDTTLTSSAAQDAQFSLSGISGTITRGSNSVSDVISGVTLNLNSIGTSTLTITPDSAATKADFSKFVSAYNDIITYANTNNEVTRDTTGSEPTNIFGPLSETRIDDSAISQIRSAFFSSSVSGGTVNTLPELGITTQRDGTLAFNTSTFDSAFASDPTSVGKIASNIGEAISSVDGVVSQYTRFGGLIDNATQNADQSIASGNDRINELESSFQKQTDSLSAQYSRLESLVSHLNQQGQSLISLLPK